MNKKIKHTSIEELKELVLKHYNHLHEEHIIAISSDDVAERAYDEIDPDSKAPPLAQFAAYTKLIDLDEERRRKRRPRVLGENQLELFEGLAKRYSVKRHGTLVDVLRQDLTLKERDRISKFLWQSSRNFRKHAEAFDAETNRLLKAGHFPGKKHA